MSEKWTPGPWSVGQLRQQNTAPRIGPFFDLGIHVGDERNKGNLLAIVCMGGKGALRTEAKYLEANANLIAAAPDLAEACKLALAQLISLGQALGEYTAPKDVDAMNAIEAALAKARGEKGGSDERA